MEAYIRLLLLLAALLIMWLFLMHAMHRLGVVFRA